MYLAARRSAIRERARRPTEAELAGIPWLPPLQGEARERALDALQVVEAEAGDYVCRIGRPVTYWFGLVDGLLKMTNDDSSGPAITFTGVAPGGWFGEGTVLKHEQYRYNIQALRKSLIAGLPVETFDWLLDHSIGFNGIVTVTIEAGKVDRCRHPSPFTTAIVFQTPSSVARCAGISDFS